jgi:hypothetical protein
MHTIRQADRQGGRQAQADTKTDWHAHWIGKYVYSIDRHTQENIHIYSHQKDILDR